MVVGTFCPKNAPCSNLTSGSVHHTINKEDWCNKTCMLYNPEEESTCNAGDLGSTAGSGISPEEGNGYPFQYSCLENPMDRGTLWAIVHRVSESWTRLSDWACTCTSLCSICLSVYFEFSFPSVPSSHHFLKHTILFPPSDSWAVYWASDPLLSSLFLHKSIPIMQVIKHSIKQVSVSVGIPFRCYSTQDAVVTK